MSDTPKHSSCHECNQFNLLSSASEARGGSVRTVVILPLERQTLYIPLASPEQLIYTQHIQHHFGQALTPAVHTFHAAPPKLN